MTEGEFEARYATRAQLAEISAGVRRFGLEMARRNRRGLMIVDVTFVLAAGGLGILMIMAG
ncbi:hypothetical protein [Cupriavidus agavae]|uniref:hypothetical protein n=1 Tax=Cupriavidus agavae TaxID=1001822 RepID=UPI00102B3FC7|nr:hypothetical protein [Cupriavidus agavae]